MITNVCFEKNNRKLLKLHEKFFQWSTKHVFIFDSNKYQLIHFQNRTSIENNEKNLQFFVKLIEIKNNCKYLRIIIDKRLKFHVHLNYIKIKIIDKFNVLRVLTNFIWEINVKNIRTIYRNTILSLFIYCVFVWYILSKNHEYKKNQNITLKILRVIQKRTIQIIKNFFKITTKIVLNVKLHLNFVNIILEYHLINNFFRSMTYRAYDEILKIKQKITIIDFNIDATNKRYTFLNSLRKLKIKYETMCKQFLSKLKQRRVFIQFFWWFSINIRIQKKSKKKKIIFIYDNLTNDFNNITIFIDENDIKENIEISIV